MVFRINDKDVLPLIAERGVKFKRNDLDGPNAGRTMDGTMYRDRVTSKTTISVECRELTTLEARYLLQLIEPEFFSVTITDPRYGEITRVMYTNNVPADISIVLHNGYETWEGISFNLIER